MTVASAVGWPDVALAAVSAIPACFTVWLAYLIRRVLKTPSGRTIGNQMEDTNHTSRSNWHYLNAIHSELNVPTPPQAAKEAEAVEGLDSLGAQ